LNASKTYMLVPSKVRAGTAACRELADVLSQWGPVAGASLGLRQAFADSATSGEGICTYSPSSTAHKEVAALAEEVTRNLGVRHEQEASLAS